MSEKKITGNVFDYPLLKRVVKLAAPYKKQFAIASVLAVLLALVTPIRPYIIQLTVDDHIMQFDPKGLRFMVLLLIGTLLLDFVLRYYFIYLTRWLGQYVIRDLRVRVFGHVTKLNLRYFDKTAIGTATTRTINDVETINDIFSQGLITIFSDLLTLFAVIVIMFVTDWRLALISMVTLPMIIYATYLFKEGIKSVFEVVRTKVAQMNAFLQEHISGMRVVQIFSAEDLEMEKFKVINQDQKRAHIKAIWYYSIFFPLVEIILAVAIGLMVWQGANMVIGDKVQVGVIIAFILYLNLLFRPLRMLADKFNVLQMGLVASSRVFNLLDLDQKIEDKGEIRDYRMRGGIEFDKVWFAYDGYTFVLKDIDFRVEPGQTIALVGSTGSGKTSVINTLSRFYEFQKGAIRIDDRDIRDYGLDCLRSNIGVVQQDVFLFSGTVMDNITLRNEELSEEQVIEAAKIVGAHDFIMKLPGRYQYNVRERGATLSMGQRQLISFIRALVYNPSILILDEATSSIDTETEALVQNAIDRLVADRTSIVIAHRLSTIQKADRIIVLDHGEIKEMGTHDELLALGGYYRRLHDMQFGSERLTG